MGICSNVNNRIGESAVKEGDSTLAGNSHKTQWLGNTVVSNSSKLYCVNEKSGGQIHSALSFNKLKWYTDGPKIDEVTKAGVTRSSINY